MVSGEDFPNQSNPLIFGGFPARHGGTPNSWMVYVFWKIHQKQWVYVMENPIEILGRFGSTFILGNLHFMGILNG